MTVKVKKWLLAMTVAATTLFCGTAVACGTDDGEKKPEPIIPPSLDSADLGTYYCDVDGTEYLITLLDNYQLAFMVKDANEIGSYAVSEEGALTFTFTDEDMGEIAATLQNNVLTFTYDDVQMRFLKKVNYTVSFEENGATELQDATVLNGKTLTAPENYEWAGHVLIGWYKEATFETPFAFGTELISGDVTLYAYWAPKAEGQEEFNVTFDYNYDGVDAETVETIGGKLYTLPQPTRDGYVFAGWWVSMYGEADKLSFAFEKGYTFTEHTTLYARWEKEDALIANVSGNEISWNAVGTGTYQLTIEGPDGFETVSETLPTTSKAFDFAAAPAGDYTITVTQGDKTTTLYYKNKALAKVSLFEVVDSTLVFNEVENAETYMIHIDCGSHTHEVAINNGKATTYNFSSCDMQEGGIVFVVEAQAKGYISSTSEAYTYNKILDAVANIQLDDETQEVSWDAVPYATNYILQIKVGNETVEVDTGSKTSYSLKDYDAGEIVVNVYPKTKGYNSPAPTTATLDKKGLATPHGLQVSDMTLTWSKIQGATKYTVQFGNKEFKDVETESLTLTAEMISLVEATDYEIRIKAIGETGESLWSDTFDVRYYAMYNTIEYSKNTVAWRSVLGADGYEVMVNGGEVLSFGASDTSAKIALTQAGNNTISVRFTDGEYRSNWVEKTVFAYTLTFDTRMGEPVADQYVALGDEYTLPAASKRGYSFEAWYSAPGGAAGNATKYESGILEKAGDFVLYAFWNANTYDIIYKYEYEGCTDGKDSTVFGESGTLEEPVNADSRYVFGGWYTQAGGQGVKVTDEFGNLLANWDYAEETTLYARWYRAFEFSLNSDGTYAVRRGLEANTSVKDLKIPAMYNGLAVTVVDGYAFRQCTNIRSVSIPDTVKVVEGTAFFGCKALEEINVYEVDGNHNKVFFSHDGALFMNDEVTSEVSLWMYPIAKTGAYVFPENVQYIPSNVFSNSLITEVTLPASLLEIASDTFVSCQNLTTIRFADSKEDNANLTIAENAFVNLKNLTTFALPKQYTSFNRAIFDGCDALVTFEVSNANAAYTAQEGVLCTIDSKIVCYPMGRTDETYTIPTTITGIQENAFQGAANLKTVVMTENVTSIGANAFAGCNALETVRFESAIAPLEIGAYAFSGLKNLSTLDFAEGNQVSSIGENAFADCQKLTQLTLPENLTFIGENAFANCSGLLNVTFPNSTKALALSANAFYNCTALTEIKLSSNVESIDMGAFGGCTALATVNVDEENEHFISREGVVYTKDQTTLVYYPVGKTDVEYAGFAFETAAIAAGAFEGNLHLKKIIIPWTITTVGDNAFKNCAALEAVGFTESENVELTIGESAFEGCAALKYGYAENIESGAWENVATLTLPKQLAALGNYAFKDTGLTSVSMKNTKVTAIGEGAFMQTQMMSGSLTNIALPDGLLSIGNQAFYNNGLLTTVELPQTLETIGVQAFANAAYNTLGSGLTAVEFPASLTAIGNEAFMYTAVASVALKAGVTYGTGVFNGAQALTEVTIDNGVTVIPENMFFNANRLAAVTVPGSVTTIGNYAFYATGIASLEFQAGEEALTIGANAFERATNLTNVNFPARVKSIGSNAFASCSGITEITFATENGKSSIELLDNYAFAYCNNLTSVTVPETEGELALGDYVFYAYEGDSKLTTLNLPSTLSSVTDYTFANLFALETINVTEAAGAKFKSVNGILYSDFGATLLLCPAMTAGEITIPNTVTFVADSAFYSCKSITGVTFEEGGTTLAIGTDMGAANTGAFANCWELANVSLPEHLTYIGRYAFAYTGLQTLSIPSSVQTIDNYAFYSSVYSKETELTSLTFETREENGVQVSNLKTIGNYAFAEAKLLKTLTIPASVETIGERAFAFSAQSALESLTFAEGSQLKTIGNYAFQYNNYITKLILPASVETIGGAAFSNWAALEEVVLPSSLTSWQYDYASYMPFYMYQNSKLKKISMAEGGTGKIEVVDNVLFINGEDGKKELVWYPTFKTENTYNVPVGTTHIAKSTFNGNTNLTSVWIPNTVTFIGTEAFRNCTNLSSVTFEKGGQEALVIDGSGYSGYAFAYTGLTEIEIPARTTSIGVYAFANNKSTNSYGAHTQLTKVTFEEGSKLESIGNYAFQNCDLLTEIKIPDSVSTIGDNAFQSCEGLTKVTLPKNLSTIAYGVFQYCYSLAEIEIPASVQSIEQYAFTGQSEYSAMSLAKITFLKDANGNSELTKIGLGAFGYNKALTKLEGLPESLEIINQSAFQYCTALESVELPDSVKYLGDEWGNGRVFVGCKSLTTINLPASLESIGSACFDSCKALESVTIPKSVTDIGSNAFYNNTSLTNVTFEEGGVEGLTIGSYAFYGTAITEFTVPSRIESLGSGMFNNCSKLVSVTFETSDFSYEIGDQMFNNCSKLQFVDLGEGATKVGNNAFAGCSSLTEILLPRTVTEIGSNAFQNCTSLTEFLLPGSVEIIGTSAFLGCNSLTYFEVDSSNVSYVSLDGLLFNSEKTELIAYPFGNTADFNLPDSLTTVAAGVFAGGKFTSFTVPAGVTELSDRFFQGCTNLTTVTLHDGITSIGNNAFDGCTALTTINNMPTNLTSIGEYAFQNCSNLTSIELHEGLKRIGNYAFQNSGLTSVTIPSTLENTVNGGTALLGLGDYAFNNSASLQTVSFNTPAAGATNTFSIGSAAFQNCTALVSIKIPSNVRSLTTAEDSGYDIWYRDYAAVGNHCFAGCTNLREVTFDETNAANFAGGFNIGDGAFRQTGIETVKIPGHASDTVRIEESYGWVNITVRAAVGYEAFYGCSSLTSVTFADSIDENATVTIYNSAFQDCVALESVTLPKNLALGFPSTSEWSTDPTNMGIGDRAFYNCKALKSLKIPEGLLGISDYAFAESGITAVDLPSSVTYIGGYAFQNCASLGAVTLKEGVTEIKYNAFYGSSLTSINIPTTVTDIGYDVFKNCTSLQSITFDEIDGQMAQLEYGLESNLFEGCTSLSSVTLPNTLTSISSAVFKGCTALESIVIPESVTEIASNAFYGTGLTAIEIPASVTSIQANAFENCSKLASVTFKEGLQRIGSAAFKGTVISTVNLPSTIATISTNAFENCAELVSVNFAENTVGLSAIEANTFKDCVKLTTINLPATVTRIGDAAFGGCSSLAAFEIPEALETLGANPFEGCAALSISVNEKNEFYAAENNMLFDKAKTKLLGVFGNPTSAVIPDTVTSIVANAFAGKTLLESVQLPAALTELDAYVFKGCTALKSIELPDGIKIANYAFAESGFTSLDVSKAASIGTYAFYNSKALESVTLPESLEMIGAYMFAGCTALKTFEIPANVTNIGNYAFAESGLTAMSIPTTVTSMGDYAFYKCADLETFTFAKNEANETTTMASIGAYTFYGCAKLKNFETPASVRSIGMYAFAESGLQSITLPEELTSLGGTAYYNSGYVFNNCKDLTTVSTLGKITAVPGYTFAGCSSLASIVLPASVTGLGGNAFEGTAITEITLPKSISQFSSNLFKDCASLKKVVFEEGITSMGYSSLFAGSALEEVVIASTITQIPYSAFENIKTLKKVTFAEGSQVSTISGYAFNGCSALESINLPEGVTGIYDWAFGGCTSLSSVTIPSTVTSLNGNVFNGWTAEQTINLPFAEGSIPTSWSTTWNTGCAATIVYAA